MRKTPAPWSIAGAWLASAFLACAAAAQVDCALPPGDEPPPTAFTRLAAAGTADDHEGADHIIVYDHTSNHVKPSGVCYSDGTVIYKVLTPAGARNLSVLTWGYEPWSSRMEVRSARVIRGEESIPVDVSAVHDLPAPQSGIYWNARLLTLQLPRLRVNDGIEVVTFRKGYSYALLSEHGNAAPAPATGASEDPDDARYVPPMPGEYFDVVLFGASVPVVEKRYTLTVPASKRLHSETYNGPLYASTTYSPDSTSYSWWSLDAPALKSEPRQADASDRAPKVVVATVESWEAKSRWFFDANRNQFEVTPEIRAKVEEIFRDADLTNASEEKKAEALVHWVAQNIRYSGQTMGEGEGFTLHPGSMIFEQRSGVCKDIAGMLITMMRAADMDSYAAMTMAGSRIEAVPADQFNHCVCALRKGDGAFEMYDPTWVPFTNDIWSKYETEQQYLIGTPRGEPLATIPYSTPEGSTLRVAHDAELLEDGTLRGTLRLDGTGALDGRLRNMVAASRIADERDAFAELLSHAGPEVTGLVYRHPRPDDFSADMWIELRYSIPGYALQVADGLEFTSPMMSVVMASAWLFRAAAPSWTDEREGDVFLYFTQLLDARETIRLPKGMKPVDAPSSDKVDETYASFKGTTEASGRNLVITARAEVRRRQIPPEGYAGFKKAIDEAREWRDRVFRIEKGGDR